MRGVRAGLILGGAVMMILGSLYSSELLLIGFIMLVIGLFTSPEKRTRKEFAKTLLSVAGFVLLYFGWLGMIWFVGWPGMTTLRLFSLISEMSALLVWLIRWRMETRGSPIALKVASALLLTPGPLLITGWVWSWGFGITVGWVWFWFTTPVIVAYYYASLHLKNAKGWGGFAPYLALCAFGMVFGAWSYGFIGNWLALYLAANAASMALILLPLLTQQPKGQNATVDIWRNL